MAKYCFETEGEAWLLAVNKNGVANIKITPDEEDEIIEKKSLFADSSFLNQVIQSKY